jgi:hypothetical protein
MQQCQFEFCEWTLHVGHRVTTPTSVLNVVFVLSADTTSDELNLVTSGAVVRVETVIGFDPDSKSVYSLTVSLDHGLPYDSAELNFWITELREDGPPIDYWDGSETRFLPASSRAFILSLILYAVEMLITKTTKDSVAMTTIGTNLPARALAKYLRIKDIFVRCGFSATERPPMYGTKCWLMERRALH